MPDTGGRRKRGCEWKLSNAHEIGQLVHVRCGHCNIKRWHEPGDLIRLFGDVDVDRLNGAMRCLKCGSKDHISAEAKSLTALERVGIRVRRLAEIKVVRRVIWRDED